MDINKIVANYKDWIQNMTRITKYDDEYYGVSFPFVDRINDCIAIFFKEEVDGSLSITDDGYTLDNLFSSGVTFEFGSKNRQELDELIRRFGLRLVDEDIVTTCTQSDFPWVLTKFIQALILIDNIADHQHKSAKDFLVEDTKPIMDDKNIFMARDISTGTTEYKK
jgi:hypothetical protein